MRCIAALIVVLPLAACASVTSLSDRDGGDSSLSDSERAIIREQVDRAREDERWTAAWNQEVEAGADRDRLESIALEALDDDATTEARMMFEELVTKWGPLTSEARARATAMAEASIADRNWGRAIDIELATAEDAPEFKRAFEVYRTAPPHKGPELLQRIQDARRDAQK